MNEKQLIEFVNWLPTAVPEFKNADPEQIVQALNQMYESEEGQQMLSQLFTAFQESKADAQSQMFKKGGKLSQLAEKTRKNKKMCCKKKETLRNGMSNKVLEKMQNGGEISSFQNGGGFYKNWSSGDIRKLQMFLAREDMLGNDAYKGELDGIIGPETIRAIKAYQKKHGYKEDGMWGYNTNQLHRVLDSSILAKGSYKPTHRTEQGNFREIPTSFSYTKLSDLSNADAQKVIDYYSINPELLFSDDLEHSKWRQIFHNSGKNGEDFINQITASLTPEERSRIDPKKLTNSYKEDQFASGVTASIDEFGREKLPIILTSPILLGTGISTAAGGALANTLIPLAGSWAGAKGAGKIGEALGEKNKDKPYVDNASAKYGVSGIVIDPERRKTEAKNQSELIGGLVGGALTGLATSATQAGIKNTINLGRSALNYKGKIKTPVTPSTSPYGSPNSATFDSPSKWDYFKAGVKASRNFKPGQIRTGGASGIQFNYKGKNYNPGTWASKDVASAADAYYNNPYSPIKINFGGRQNIGTGVKLKDSWGINLLPTIEIGAAPSGLGIIANDVIEKKQDGGELATGVAKNTMNNFVSIAQEGEKITPEINPRGFLGIFQNPTKFPRIDGVIGTRAAWYDKNGDLHKQLTGNGGQTDMLIKYPNTPMADTTFRISTRYTEGYNPSFTPTEARQQKDSEYGSTYNRIMSGMNKNIK